MTFNAKALSKIGVMLIAAALIFLSVLTTVSYAGEPGPSDHEKIERLRGKSTVVKPCTGKPGHPPGLSKKSNDQSNVHLQAAAEVLERWLPCKQARQFRLKVINESEYEKETFEISGKRGHITIAGTSTSALLSGWNWYIKYVVHANISLNGEQLNLQKKLPAPDQMIRHHANVTNRFALNDTDEGYTEPNAGWEYWQRKIDVLAMHGINQVLVYPGQEAVYYETFQEFGYSKEELRNWIPQPAHQPWWLLQNLSSFPSSISQPVMDKRIELGKKIVNRLRDLGMTPVFPGYYGTIPPGFENKNPGAHTVPQGTWIGGFQRPDWLDPTNEFFPEVAKAFYSNQEDLFGRTTMFKMDLLHEGGRAGNVDVGEASKAVQKALEDAHPKATWAILGWQSNPRKETLAAVDRSKMLILDGLSDRYSGLNREEDWLNTPFAFGSIWNFGGHTTMGANMSVWNSKYWDWLNKEDSKLSGIAVMPEASDNNPVAFDFMTEMAWRDEPVDLNNWFADWAHRRYGQDDPHARAGWHALQNSAYSMPDNGWSEAQDGLFGARPSLTANSAAAWSPKSMRYDAGTFAKALPELLKVSPSLRSIGTYRYDLMDVTRQVLSNESRVLLPAIKKAYESKDKERFHRLTNQWLHWIKLLDKVVGTNKHTMLGPWLEKAKSYGSSDNERAQLEYDARSLLTIWGNEAAANSGLHDYANREWQGLVGDYYYSRWKTYFDSLKVALETGSRPETIDWYAFGNKWAQKNNNYPTRPSGEVYKIAQQVYSELSNLTLGGVEVKSSSAIVAPGKSITITATFANQNWFVAARAVNLNLNASAGFTTKALTDTSTEAVPPGETFTVEWKVTAPEETNAQLKAGFTVEGAYKIEGTNGKATDRIRILIENGVESPYETVTFNDAKFSQSKNEFAIYGAGNDMWGSTNEYGTIYHDNAFNTGDTAAAEVVSQDRTGPWARAGLVARNELSKQNRSAGYINIAITPDQGCVLSWDSNEDGRLDSYKNSPEFTAPVYIQLSRDGLSFTGKCSNDGETWTTIGTVTVPGTASTLDVGLFMTAANGSGNATGLVHFKDFLINAGDIETTQH